MKSWLYNFIGFVLLVSLLMLHLTGYAEAGSRSASALNLDTAGYYRGSGVAIVKQGDNKTSLTISNLEAMVSGNRIMMLSVSHNLLYDITVDDISGKAFTGTARVYDSSAAKQVITSATVSGVIASGPSIKVTLTGSGVGAGSFKLSHSNQKDVLSPEQSDWMSHIGTSKETYVFVLVNAHALSTVLAVKSGYFSACAMKGKLAAVFTTGLYNVSVRVTGCDDPGLDGLYTGFAAPKNPQTTVMSFAVTNSDGGHAVSGDFQQPTL